MHKASGAPQLTTIDRVLLGIDDGIPGSVCRIAIGFATLPAMSLLLGVDSSEWMIVPFLLLILLLLRVVPTVIRKLVPFSDAVQLMWAERRRMAKRYDSYQWKKLTWIGVGLGLYVAVSGQFSTPRIIVCLLCLLGGTAGMLTWHVVSANRKPAQPSLQEGKGAA